MFKHHCRKRISLFDHAFLQCKILLLSHVTKSMNLDTMPCARGARNNEIERHRVRSCQAPQMPSVQGCESGVGSLLYMCGIGLCPFSGLVYDLLLRGRRGLSPDCVLPQEYLIHNLDVHCLENNRAFWCLTYPSGATPFHWALRSLVIREARLLELVSPRMHASPQTLSTVLTQPAVNCFYPTRRPTDSRVSHYRLATVRDIFLGRT